MIEEPAPGDRVRFRETGRARIGTVAAVITAGRASGSGLHRLRRRARIRFESGGQCWETHRDLTEITITAADEQLTLFEAAAAETKGHVDG